MTEIDNYYFFNTDNNYDKDQDNDCDELEQSSHLDTWGLKLACNLFITGVGLP